MAMGTLLIACPSCSCHAFARETHCPSCGAPLRGADGSIQRTAGAVVLGLTLAVGVAGSTAAGCGGGNSGSTSTGEVGGMGGQQAVSAYGVGPGVGPGGMGGMGGAGGMGGIQAVSAYGVAVTSGNMVTGTGGAGGQGGAGGK